MSSMTASPQSPQMIGSDEPPVTTISSVTLGFTLSHARSDVPSAAEGMNVSVGQRKDQRTMGWSIRQVLLVPDSGPSAVDPRIDGVGRAEEPHGGVGGGTG